MHPENLRPENISLAETIQGPHQKLVLGLIRRAFSQEDFLMASSTPPNWYIIFDVIAMDEEGTTSMFITTYGKLSLDGYQIEAIQKTDQEDIKKYRSRKK